MLRLPFLKVALCSLAVLGFGHSGSPVCAQSWFRVGTDHGRSIFLRPDGSKFWSLGCCCTDPGQDWKTVDPANPSYHAYSMFPDSKSWVKDTESKLTSWGFNTLGGWSSNDLFAKHGSKMPYTVVLHLGAWNKAPWKDIFTTETSFWADHAAKEQIEPIKDDPNLIGYFTDNELGWWDDTIFLHYLRNLLPTEPGRKRAHAELKAFYKGSFSAFKKDWFTRAKSWTDLSKNPDLKLIPGSNGMRAVNNWMAVVGDYYGKLVSSAIRKFDKNHLILGERYVQFYNQSYARAASNYCDVVSTNAGANWTDGTYCHFFLQTLHNLTRKPVLITEFYMAAQENRSGNKNSGTAFPIVKTQKERAASFRKCLETFASRPFVVGAHWFQYFDEPSRGRGDGEDFNMGLVDVWGVPYEDLTSVSKDFDPWKIELEGAYKSSLTALPKWTLSQSKPESLLDWPRGTCFVPSTSDTAFSDLYGTWDEDFLTFGLYAVDYIDPSLYVGDEIPDSERPTFKLSLGSRNWTVRFGGWRGKGDAKKDMPATADDPKLLLAESPNLTQTLIVRIPKSELVAELLPGTRLKLKATLDSHSRAETMAWNTTITLRP